MQTQTTHRSDFSVNKISLSAKNILQNYLYLSALNPAVAVAPVLKSNAYGHGLIQVARILDGVGVPFFCVNSFYEAHDLYIAGIKTPVFIMGYVDPDFLKNERYPFSYTTHNYEQLRAISRYQPGAGLHIFVDTGMHREGFRIDKLPTLLKNLKALPNINIVGLMSHLAQGDKPESEQTQEQLKNFKKAFDIISRAGMNLRYQHIAASPGLLSLHEDFIGNVARTGKALYGVDPRGKNSNLKPALTLTTQVVQVKKLRQGDPVGYDAAYRAKKDVTVAVLPIGYYDGVDRRLSDKGYMSLDGIPCPIVGRVSMNITTIDVSSVKNPRVGQKVTVISDDAADRNSIENIAKDCGTIPYDIVVHLAPTLSRSVEE